MNTIELAQLTAATFELKRSLLQFKQAQTDCTIAQLQLQQSEQSSRLAITQHHQAQLVLATIAARYPKEHSP